MNPGCKKYIPFTPVSLPDRTWPDKRIEKALKTLRELPVVDEVRNVIRVENEERG